MEEEGKQDMEKTPEGEGKVKRKMKTAAQLELLENTYALEQYPSEALRADLSVKLGLSDRQLQMWFCHRRLKDRKPTPPKRPRKDSSPAAGLGSSGGVGIGDEIRALGSFSHIDLQKRMIVPNLGVDVPDMKRFYQPPQALSELRAIEFIEAQLGEPLRKDGPILGLEFDPLPPGAFGTPIALTSGQQKSVGGHYEVKLYERLNAKPIQASARALHEYQFLPEKPCVKSDAYERPVSLYNHNSPAHLPSSRTSSSNVRLVAHGNEQLPSAYGFQVPFPNLSLLPQQGRQGHLLASTSTDHDTRAFSQSFPIIVEDAHPVSHPISGFDSSLIPSERQVILDDDILRIEKKRKFDEARIAREAEANEKRIRKELEKQDILMRKREEQMRKEMERQDRERRKEEERLLREKQREEERLQREQRREMERREKFLLKESMRAEKLRIKEEMRREKEAAKLKLANERATARKIAKESMELIDDERVELMDIAASRKGLPSIMSLDSDALQNLELFRDVSSNLQVWRFLVTFADVLGIWPFTIDEFVQAFHDHDSRLLAEIHVALLKSIIKDIEDVARSPSFGLGANQNSAANPEGGHPQIVEGAYAWGFDIRSWQRHLNPLTWPEILRQFALSAGFGPKLRKRSAEQTYFRDENEGNGSEDVILTLRDGSAAKKAFAIMHERGYSNPRRSRHRLTPGTVKYAAFHVLSLEGGRGLTILDVADRIQTSGLRDLTTSKTPEASIAAALSRDTKLFERTAPSTYCVRAPYRKDPADAEALLSAAREKILVYKNGILDGDVEDVDKEEAERDADSESDVAEELEVEDIGSNLKPSKDVSSCEPTDSQLETKSASGKEILQEVLEPSEHHLENVVMTSLEAVPNKEDTEIDESQSVEPWVQGLVDGEYSDLSVEERLNALVALIGVANEGNSIRIILEDRMEAANALKKQMWADAQTDKRRMKEDCVMRIPYSSIICSKGEENISTAVVAGKQSSRNDGKSDISSIQSEVMHEHLGDLYVNTNSMHAERCSSMQELPVATDSSPLVQAVYAAEKSRSRLKSIILQKADEMYVHRSLPLGQDRRRNCYWQFVTSASLNDPGNGRIFVQMCNDSWKLIDSEEDFDALLASLDVRGVRESHLFSMLQLIEMSFKETVRKNLSRVSSEKNDESVETMAPEMNSDDQPCAADSPSSRICLSNPDMPESSVSFKIGLGSNETEVKDALQRHQEFEKWMWKECFNPSILRAMRYGKPRGKPVYSVCDFCRSLYEESCPCQYTSNVSTGDSSFSEYVNCREKLCSDAGITAPSVRISLLIAQLASIEVSIPVEALQSVWSDDSRKSWGMKLQTATSAEELLQILTLLEGCIKRDFLLSDYETTSELLVSSDSTGPKTHGTSTPEVVPVLPWLPQTTSSVALRLMELDSSISYMLSQKEDSQKEEGYSDLAAPSSIDVVKEYISEGEAPEASQDAGSLHQEACVKTSGHRSSGRRRGRGRGQGHSYGGRSQKRVGLEAGQKNTSNADGFKQLRGWKSGKTRGRGGRKRGQWSVGNRSAKNKQKATKKSTGVSGDSGETGDISVDRTPANSVLKWNIEPPPAYSPEESSTSDSQSEDNVENGLASAEYDDIMVDNYPNMYNSRQLEYDVNGDEDYDDRAEAEEDGNDDDMDDFVEDEQEDVERYFNGYSDEDGSMEDMDKKQTGNTDDITESASEDGD
uniref:Homeobox domain-containing protein n=1 Tax=Daucus carota subsp. sativus TaxID=79200 RepID=A0A161ZWH5_DAUCS